MKNGEKILDDVPTLLGRTNHVLSQATGLFYLLSTEKILVEFGNAILIQKARKQWGKVKMVLDKICIYVLRPTLEAVFNKKGEAIFVCIPKNRCANRASFTAITSLKEGRWVGVSKG